MIRITSVDPALDRPRVRSTAANLVRRAVALGMLADRGEIDRLDLALIESIAREASSSGVGQQAAVALIDRPAAEHDLEDALVELDEAIGASPVPDRELRELLRTYDPAMLARMIGISPASLRRYASGTRPAPDDVAERIHFIALVTSDLAGSYNDYGLRRWWERPRTSLGGSSPRASLGSGWDADGPAAMAIRELAAPLAGGMGAY